MTTAHLVLGIPAGHAHRVAWHLRRHLLAFAAQAEVLPTAVSSMLIVRYPAGQEHDLRIGTAIRSVRGVISCYHVSGLAAEALMHRFPAPAPRFSAGQRVLIRRGPLRGAEGMVRSVNADLRTCRVALLLLGREPEADLKFTDIEACPSGPEGITSY